MAKSDLMSHGLLPFRQTITGVILMFLLVSCVKSSPSIPETRYSSEIVGTWQGTVGGLETMSLNRDGTFVCRLHPMGFLANTLSQGVAGTIRGT
ncbi:MAG: hypothetical protein ABSH12_01820 [Endomicrobiales bacterium]|jgi:hypothetical protein